VAHVLRETHAIENTVKGRLPDSLGNDLIKKSSFTMSADVISVGRMAKAHSGVAWIVGVGASAGLGSALARRFAKGGLTVALTGRSEARLRSIEAEIAEAGGQAHALPGDISFPSEVTRLSTAVCEIGALRAAVFNAGNMVRGTALEVTPEAFESTWRGSAYAGFLFVRATLPLLLESHGGSLLLTGATASVRGGGAFIAFASAKSALRSLAQSAAREYGPLGIHVAHVIIDGGIDGERLRTGAPDRAAAAGQDGLLHPDAIAETFWHLHQQPRSAWTHELDLRPFKERF
jgi:NAD(P)-dependent dehydrogenase (short-subunit alcohol dehydrogenase family)